MQLHLKFCERFSEALSLLSVNPSTGYERLGYQNPSTLYSIIAGRCLPDMERLSMLARITTPGGYRINIDWLITGTGEKLIPTKIAKIRSSKIELLLTQCPVRKIAAVETLLENA